MQLKIWHGAKCEYSSKAASPARVEIDQFKKDRDKERLTCNFDVA